MLIATSKKPHTQEAANKQAAAGALSPPAELPLLSAVRTVRQAFQFAKAGGLAKWKHWHVSQHTVRSHMIDSRASKSKQRNVAKRYTRA